MPFPLRRLTTMQLIALGSVIFIAIAGFALNKRNSTTNSQLSAGVKTAVPAYQGQGATGLLEVERVTLRAAGFEPVAIVRPKKNPFFLIIENRTRLRDLSYQISNEAGNRVNDRDLVSPRGKLAWNGVVNLPPGNYRLTERNHREWSLSITIENK